MSDQKRPQLAPEVLEPTSTESAGTNANQGKEPRSFTVDTTVGSTEQVSVPLSKASTRPAVEVVADFSPGTNAQSAEPVREPLPRPVARPIVEVVADIPSVNAQNAEPVREPLPRPVARPIVEVVADFSSSTNEQSAEPMMNTEIANMNSFLRPYMSPSLP